MFIALRDLRFARGRFALLIGLMALMTLMVVLLSGLTAGLANASTSAIDRLPVTSIAFQTPPTSEKISFATSTLPGGTIDALRRDGATVFPIGVSTSRFESSGNSAAVTVFGADSDLYPSLRSGTTPGPGEAAVTAALADEVGVAPGDWVRISGQDLTVTAVVDDTTFNHLPVVYTAVATWKQLSHTDSVTAAGITGQATAQPGVTIVDRTAAFDAIGGYASEHGSLALMQGLLLVVSALIVGAFFTVWTMQRSADLAVVRALGASRRYLLRDALGQAIIVLLAGAAAGVAVAAGIGLLAAQVMPFVLDTATVALPAAAMIAVGLAGAAASVRRVTAVDPITALGAAR
jgi:putative ABC transport system permease protein